MITSHNSDKILVILTKHHGFVIDRISNSQALWICHRQDNQQSFSTKSSGRETRNYTYT